MSLKLPTSGGISIGVWIRFRIKKAAISNAHTLPVLMSLPFLSPPRSGNGYSCGVLCVEQMKEYKLHFLKFCVFV